MKKFEDLDPAAQLVAKAVHMAIHSHATEAKVGSISYPILCTPNNLRFVELNAYGIGDAKIIQQNPCKPSAYAVRARNGEAISWIIPKSQADDWTLIDLPVLVNP